MHDGAPTSPARLDPGRLASLHDADDADGGGVADGLRHLREVRALDPERVAEPGTLAPLLRDVASANLPLARLLEGHANAWRIVAAHATAAQRLELESTMREGALLGVWAADGAEPVGWDGARLTGAKRYASGLGLVGRAIVTARAPDGQRLLLVDVDDPVRHRPAEWDMAGMQASRSGGFDCTGLVAEPIGPADAYQREPWFVGGTWRIAAVTLGATLGLLDAAAGVLRARGHLEAAPQLLRLGPVAARAVLAWDGTVAAGMLADGPAGRAAPDRAAVRSAAARLLSEEIGQDAVAAVERSVGLGLFAAGDPTGRRSRDLACYMRQVARDAFALRVATALLGGGRRLAEWTDG